ncbi:Uncharacterized protein At4g37920 [Linum grandiflorum]
MANFSFVALDLPSHPATKPSFPGIITTTSCFSSFNDPLNQPTPNYSLSLNSPHGKLQARSTRSHGFNLCCRVSEVANAPLVEEERLTRKEVEVGGGYTMTQFCDKMIDVFLSEKRRAKDWRKYLLFREEWNKYKDSFYSRCQVRANMETDAVIKEKLTSLAYKVKTIDDEMEKHTDLLKEIRENPTDLNVIVAKRRKDFTGEFFRHLGLLADTYDSLEDGDDIARLGARCLSAVSAFDSTLENLETLESAQEKFDDILNSPSVDAACEKIKSLAKAKELDSSLILLINSTWAAAKESSKMTNEVKEIMYQIYKTTKSSLRSIAPKEIKLLKHLLNITDPEERFSALATAFCPGDDQEAKNPYALYTTPKELHKWIKIMLDAYQMSKDDTEIREAKQLSQPVVMQRLLMLQDIIEEEYMEKTTFRTPSEGDSSSVASISTDLDNGF